MCGFVSVFDANLELAPDLIAQLSADIVARGPDDQQFFQDTAAALIFCRLAVIDPKPRANQPFSDISKRYHIVCDGRIYNYIELRRTLQATGCLFYTDSDTEVLLQAYLHWGIDMLKKVEGMFAFVIYDKIAQTVFAARDPLGIKPLYATSRGPLAYSSLMTPLVRLAGNDLNEAAFAELMMYQYVAGTQSNYKYVREFLPGTYECYDINTKQLQRVTYYSSAYSLHQKIYVTEENANAQIKDLITNSLKIHARADVGLSLQVSSSLDTEYVAQKMAQTLSQQFCQYAVALQAFPQQGKRIQSAEALQIISVGEQDLVQALPAVSKHLEGPCNDIDSVLSYLLYRHIDNPQKVVISSAGVSALFADYFYYKHWQQVLKQEQYGKFLHPWLRPLLSKYHGLFKYYDLPAELATAIENDYAHLHMIFPDLVPELSYRRQVTQHFSDFRDKLLAHEQSCQLQTLLMRQDKLAMAASKEIRLPFVSQKLFDYMNSINHDMKSDNQLSQGILARDRLSPTHYPLADWLANTNGLGQFLDNLRDKEACLYTYADYDMVQQYIQRFTQGERELAKLLLKLISTELWMTQTPSQHASMIKSSQSVSSSFA